MISTSSFRDQDYKIKYVLTSKGHFYLLVLILRSGIHLTVADNFFFWIVSDYIYEINFFSPLNGPCSLEEKKKGVKMAERGPKIERSKWAFSDDSYQKPSKRYYNGPLFISPSNTGMYLSIYLCVRIFKMSPLSHKGLS